MSLLPVASLGLLILSQFEHRKSIKPSSLILLYLLFFALFDLVQLTLPSLRNSGGNHGPLVIGLQLAAKIVVVYVECLGKESILIEEEVSGHDLLEERASILSRALVSWIGPVLKEGYRMVLVNERLPSVDHKLASGTLRASILRTLSEYCKFEAAVNSVMTFLMCLHSLLPSFVSVGVGSVKMSSRSLFNGHRPAILRHLLSLQPAGVDSLRHRICTIPGDKRGQRLPDSVYCRHYLYWSCSE